MTQLRALSWGVGVQSTALAVMSALGELPKLDIIITADTGWERQATYEIRDFYQPWLENRGIKVEIVGGRDIRQEGAHDHIHIPFWTSTGGPLRRQCTRDFKIRPIKRRLRELAGFHRSLPPNPPANLIELWLGISWDESERMNKSRVAFINHRWPLLETRISREACINYLREKRLPVPIKSACIGCPYRLASEWIEMRESTPAEFADAVAFDEENRHNPLAATGSTADLIYIYKQAIPLATADLEAHAARERQFKQMSLLCDTGYCHV